MIEIVCRREWYTYNVYHITKAFFPEEDVQQKVEEESEYEVRVKKNEEDILTITKEEILAKDPSLKDLDVTEKKKIKYQVDRMIYACYQKITGRELAWGLLTGVRPTKIAMSALERGMKKEEFVSWFMEDSLVSEEKARLAYDIAGREKALLSKLDYENGYSMYVGIPFCPSICSYCSFSSGSISQWKNYIEDYVEALCKEIRFIGEASKNKKLDTIYIGGGTPTSLNAQQLDRLLTVIDENFNREEILEYTVEAGRPDSITIEKLEVLRKHDITRISINPQTMQDRTLELVGRKHTAEDVVTIFKKAREMGFDNINMDLIAGLPEETEEDMEDTLSKIEALQPDSLTVHALAIKRAAKMGQEERKAGFGKEITAMVKSAANAAEKMGLKPYYLYRQKNIAGNFENVGYAKVDKAGIYNILIMEEKQSIIAAGAGSSTKIVLKDPIVVPGSKNQKETTLVRVENVKNIREYIERIDEMIERKGEWLWR